VALRCDSSQFKGIYPDPFVDVRPKPVVGVIYSAIWLVDGWLKSQALTYRMGEAWVQSIPHGRITLLKHEGTNGFPDHNSGSHCQGCRATISRCVDIVVLRDRRPGRGQMGIRPRPQVPIKKSASWMLKMELNPRVRGYHSLERLPKRGLSDKAWGAYQIPRLPPCSLFLRQNRLPPIRRSIYHRE
jgi:hypothetical protein